MMACHEMGIAMADGLLGADSSSAVTTVIDGRNLIDLARETLGETPVVWGRYFTSAATSGTVEYRHRQENYALRANDIRVVPLARQTKHVDGTQADGSADAEENIEDIIKTFGADYLASRGGKVIFFLDVEGAPSMSSSYYLGWSQTLVSHGKEFSGGLVTPVPGVYATQADDPTWRALKEAMESGGPCGGIWVARWRIRGCGDPIAWDDNLVTPAVDLPCKVLIWQYADECHGGNGYDCNRINPGIDREEFLSMCVLPPETPIA
jgi:hypothetical protein